MPGPGADVSTYPTAQASPNALGVLGQFAGVQNALNQNALFQQTFAARKAIGGIMQQSIDPQTGAIDYNKAAVLLSTNPDAAFMAPDIINGWTQRQLIQAETVGKHLANTKSTYDMIAQTAGSLLTSGHANGDKVSRADLVGAIATLRGQGVPKEALDNFLMQVPSDPRQIYQMLVRTAQWSAGVGDALGRSLGGMPTAGEANVPVTRVGPDGSKYVTPRGATPGLPLLTGTGQPAATGGLPASGVTAQNAPVSPPPATPAPTPASPPITGRAGTHPLQPTSISQGAQGQAQPGVQTELSPYKTKALEDVATKYEPELNDRVRTANQLNALMSQAQDYLKDFKPGGGTQTFEKMARLAQSVGVPQETIDRIVNSAGGPSAGLGSVQAAQKIFMGVGSTIAAQLVRAGGGRMTQTEWGRVLSEGAPNLDLDPRGIAKIMSSMKELTHYTTAESDFFNKYKAQGRDLTQWQNEWSNLFGAMQDMRARLRSQGRGAAAGAQP